ncbi:hypothetical protein RI367_002762 [Sorochytrium milnesiophthora]
MRIIHVLHQLPVAIAAGQVPSLSHIGTPGTRRRSGSGMLQLQRAAAPAADGSSTSSDSNSGQASPPSTAIVIDNKSQQGSAADSPQLSIERRRGHSVLFAGIASLTSPADNKADVYENVYVGSLGQVVDRETDTVCTLDAKQRDEIKQMVWDKHQCIPVFNSEKVERGHYDGYCKQVLWPMLHYILVQSISDGRQEGDDWVRYRQVNQAYADAVAEVYQDGDMVWVHDYHLLLVPSMLRAQKSRANIGLFLHTPFPSSEIFRCLPTRVEILTGMLGANLLGFQTYAYARHFVSTCTRVLGLESTPTGIEFNGSVITVGIFPVGVDAARTEISRATPAVTDKMASLRAMYGKKKIIVGRDKLDQNRGVYQKLLAFEKFLEVFPEWQGEVVLVQVTSPSATDSMKLESKVSELVASINGRFGSISFTPVHHIHQLVDSEEYYALLSVADVGLITSVRDGMNTTSHEFVICQQDNCGPLILSEFTGTAGSMSAAILVNPWDYLGVAHAINDALVMTREEKVLRERQLLDHVKQNTAQHWAHSFIRELIELQSAVGLHAQPTPVLDSKQCKTSYDQATRRLIIFDYDGTLTPIVALPHEAMPSKRMLAALTKLCADPCNTVFIVSGRDAATLEEWVGGVPNLGLSAEHGCFLRYPHSKWINFSENLDLSWKKEVVDLFTYYSERTAGAFVEQKRCAVTWHYRQADPEYGIFQAKECQNHLENAVVSKYPIEILIGKKNLEVRPVSINKGEIVKRLLGDTAAAQPNGSNMSPLSSPQVNGTHATATAAGGDHPLPHGSVYDFVYCAGDDKTDEDMFKMVRRCQLPPAQTWSVTVGPANKRTSANWHSLTPEEVIETMELWVGTGSQN